VAGASTVLKEVREKLHTVFRMRAAGLWVYPNKDTSLSSAWSWSLPTEKAAGSRVRLRPTERSSWRAPPDRGSWGTLSCCL